MHHSPGCFGAAQGDLVIRFDGIQEKTVLCRTAGFVRFSWPGQGHEPERGRSIAKAPWALIPWWRGRHILAFSQRGALFQKLAQGGLGLGGFHDRRRHE
jgi:hypothetical protein